MQLNVRTTSLNHWGFSEIGWARDHRFQEDHR